MSTKGLLAGLVIAAGGGLLLAACVATGTEPEGVDPGPAPDPTAEELAITPQEGGRVAVCHQSSDRSHRRETIWVRPREVARHLAHGDYLGACVGSCLSRGEECSHDLQCCSRTCDRGRCAGWPGGCQPAGEPCSHDAQCCSESCRRGECQ